MQDIIGHGGGKGGGSSHTHYEAPDSLHSTSYARVLDLVSEGEILGLAEGLQSVYLNDTPVQNADGTSNFQDVTVDLRTGTQDQDYIPGFPDVESETAVGVELKYGTPWVRAIGNTALSAIRITLGIDQLYKANTDNGDVGGSIVNYRIELSTDGGAYQVVLASAFNGKTMSAYQRTARIDLPRATSGWQLRVTRLTPNSAVVSVVDKTNIVSFTEVIDAKLRYPMSAIVGIQVDAKQFQSVPTRAYDVFGRIIQVPSNYDSRTRAYTGTWDGTFKPSWSDNPAWVFRDLVLHDRYGLGNRITAAQLDKWALYKIARYCDDLVPDGKGGTEPRFTCNLYLQTRKQAYAVLQDIASIFRGISYWGAGTIMASADMPSDPVYVYTAANVIGGKFTRTGTKKSTRYTVALVTWNDPADGYKPKVEYVEDREGIARYGIQQIELPAFGCASQGQAQRAGRWALATSRLETEGLSFDVGMDGAIALPGQVVRIADPSRMGRRVGGRVRAVAGRTITLDKAPTVKAGDRLTVMLPAGVSETRVVASIVGDAVTVNADWSTAPRVQAVWSADSDELSAPLFRVLSVVEKDEITFTITAVQHEPGKYDFVENGTAITPRTQTALDVTRQAPPASVTLAGYTVSLADVQKLALQVSCAPVAGAVAYEGAYRRGNDNWVAIPRQASPTMDVLDVLPGTYMAKMSAVNSIGVTSIETQSVAVEIARDGVSKSAALLLDADARSFHTNQAGETDPAVINIEATLIALIGPVTWSIIGAKLANTTATTAQLKFADMSAASAEVTASVTAFGRTYSKSIRITQSQDGAAGADGLKTETARLFQWAPVAPARPKGKSVFDWPHLANTGYTGNDGWANPAPANPGTPGWRLFSASVPIAAAAAAETSPVDYTNAVVEDGAQNGAAGVSGLQSRPLIVYRWDVSLPAGPTGPGTLKWADGSFGAAPAGWSLVAVAPTSLGMTQFAATVQVVDVAGKATTDFNWQSASVMVVGYVGTNGGPGQQGASYVTAYIASSAIAANGAPAQTTGRTSLPAANSSGLAGTWSAAVPPLADNQRMYQSDGIYDPTTDKVTWSIPYWSSLKVATLAAITVGVMGDITAGSMNIGNGKFVVTTSGDVTLSSWRLVDPNTGKTMGQAGGTFSPDFMPAEVKNSALVPSIQAAATTATADGFSGVIGGDNLAPNSSFENMVNGLAAGYGIYNNAGGAEPTYANEGVGRTGGKAQVISWDGNHTETKGILGVMCRGGWVPGKEYTLAVWAKTTNLSNPIGAGLSTQWNTWPAVTAIQNPPINTIWQRYIFRLTWGASVEPGGVGYITIDRGTGNGNVSFDDLMVVEGNVMPSYYPSTAEAQAAADAALSKYETLAADGVLDRGEKSSQLIPLWNDEAAAWTALRARAVAFGLDVSPYDGPFYAASNYLSGLYPYWNDTANDTAINRNDFNTVFANLSKARSDMQSAIAAKSANASADITLIGRGCTVVGTSAKKSIAERAWNADVYSTQQFTGGAFASAKIVGNYYVGFGLNNDPATDSSYESITLWFETTEDGLLISYINAEEIWRGRFNVNDDLYISYDEVYARWYQNGVLVKDRLIYLGDNVPLGFDSTFYTPGAIIEKIRCGPFQSALFGKIGGADKPEPYATKGAPSGTMVGGTEAGLLASRALNGQTAFNGLPDKLSQTAGGVMQGGVFMQASGAIVVGNASYAAPGFGGTGTVVSAYGIACVQNGVPKFAMSAAGDVFFAGEMRAAYGTLGTLRIAAGGFIAQNYGGTWNWGDKGAGPGFLVHPNGMLFGDQNDANLGYVLIGADGRMSMPGFSYTGRQLRLDSPLIINPVLSPFKVSVVNSLNQYDYNLYRQSTDAYAGLYIATVDSGNDGATFNWAVSGPWPCWLVQDSTSNRVQLHINMKGGAALVGDEGDFNISLSVTKGGNTVQSGTFVVARAS